MPRTGPQDACSRDVLIETDFVGIVRGIDDTADRFGLFDLLALDAQKLRQPAAFADGDEIEPGCRAIRAQFRLHNKILQNAFRGDAGGIGLDRRLAVWRLAGILRRFLELVERNETLGSALDNGFNMLGRHDHSPFRAWVQSAPRACTPARRRDRGSKGKGGRGGSFRTWRSRGRSGTPPRPVPDLPGLHPCPREGGALSSKQKKGVCAAAKRRPVGSRETG